MFLKKSDRIEKLAAVELFREFSKGELRKIDQRAKEVEVKAGRTLAKEGEPGREFMLIVQGKAHVERGGKTIAHLRGGDFFGELSLIDGEPRNASVISDGPMVLLVVTKQAFNDLMRAAPTLQRKVLIGVIARLREANKKVAALN